MVVWLRGIENFVPDSIILLCTDKNFLSAKVPLIRTPFLKEGKNICRFQAITGYQSQILSARSANPAAKNFSKATTSKILSKFLKKCQKYALFFKKGIEIYLI